MIFLHTLTIILTIFFAFMVAFSMNPMNSIIFLIGIFFNSFITLFYFSVEFLGLLFILIYVGAIAILFLFVIMMLNLKSTEVNVLNIDFISKIFLAIILIYLFFFATFHFFDSLYADSESFLFVAGLNATTAIDIVHNANSVGQTLFNYFNGCFLVAGLVLLTALVGAITLSQNFSTFKPKQSPAQQLGRCCPRLIATFDWWQWAADSSHSLGLLVFALITLAVGLPAVKWWLLSTRMYHYLKWVVGFGLDAYIKLRIMPRWKSKAKPIELLLESLYHYVYTEMLLFPGGFAGIMLLLNTASLLCSWHGMGVEPMPGVDPILPPEQELIDSPAEVPITDAKTNWIIVLSAGTVYLVCWAIAYSNGW